MYMLFYMLWIFVGMHGAGLTKQIFMPGGGIIFEITAELNDVQMVSELTFASD